MEQRLHEGLRRVRKDGKLFVVRQTGDWNSSQSQDGESDSVTWVEACDAYVSQELGHSYTAKERTSDQSLHAAAKLEVVPWKLDLWKHSMPKDVVSIFGYVEATIRQANEQLAALEKPYSVRACLSPDKP